MKYNIAQVTDALDTRNAALLTQRLAPLARSYRNIYSIRKEHRLPEQASAALKGECESLANEIVSQILAFINENPYDIPRES